MAETALITSFAELLSLLTQANVPHAVDPERQLIEAPIHLPPLEGSLLMRWPQDLPYLQLMLVMLKDVPQGRIRDVEIACCRANTAVALPGFGIDHGLRIIYFRQILPVMDGIFANTLQRMVMAVAGNARELVTAFQAVVDGKAGDSIIQLAVAWAQEDAAARQPPPV